MVGKEIDAVILGASSAPRRPSLRYATTLHTLMVTLWLPIILTLVTVTAGVALVAANTESIPLLVLASLGGLVLGLPIFWFYAYTFCRFGNSNSDSGNCSTAHP